MLIKFLLNGKTLDLTGDTINIKSDNFSVDKTGAVKATAGEIGGFITTEDEFSSDLYSEYAYTQTDLDKIIAYIMGTGELTSEEIELYDVDRNLIVDARDYMKIKKYIESEMSSQNPGKVILTNGDVFNTFTLKDSLGNDIVNLNLFESYFDNLRVKTLNAENLIVDVTDKFEFNGIASGKVYKIGKIVFMQIYLMASETSGWGIVATVPNELYPLEVFDDGTPISGTNCWIYGSSNEQSAGMIRGSTTAGEYVMLCGTYITE